ncbi:MAG: RNA polymerase sigma factor [Pseudomonadota bacterium]
MKEQQIEELLSRIATREEQAFEQLYRAFAAKINAFVLHGMFDRDCKLAEEIVSDTLFTVWEKPHAFNRQCKFSTWLFGIARNKLLYALRKEGKLRIDRHTDAQSDDEKTYFDNQNSEVSNTGTRQSDFDAIDGVNSEHHHTSQQPSKYDVASIAQESDVFELVAEKQARQAVSRCVLTLNADQRQCLFLVHWECMSQSEVATVLEIPLGTVKSRVRIAYEKLKSCLEKMCRGHRHSSLVS